MSLSKKERDALRGLTQNLKIHSGLRADDSQDRRNLLGRIDESVSLEKILGEDDAIFNLEKFNREGHYETEGYSGYFVVEDSDELVDIDPDFYLCEGYPVFFEADRWPNQRRGFVLYNDVESISKPLKNEISNQNELISYLNEEYSSDFVGKN